MKRFSFILSSFSLIVLFSIITLITPHADAILLSKTNLEHYLENELILVGKIISTNEIPDKTETEYQVEVERYLKSPKSPDLITVFGQGMESSPFRASTDKIFDVGSRVFLLLNEFEGRYMISPYSYNAEFLNPELYFILPPLKLYKAGISPDEIVCRGDLIIVLKSSNGNPACVIASHIDRLVSRGWLDDQYLKLIK